MDGYSGGGVIDDDVGEFIARERLCCPFFQFDLEGKPDNGPVRLKFTGDDSVQQYVEDTVLMVWDF